MRLIHAADAGNKPHDPYQDLAIAVIKQAAYDYRVVARKLESIENSGEKWALEKEMKSIRRFFLGDWFETLSNSSSGSKVLEILDKEV